MLGNNRSGSSSRYKFLPKEEVTIRANGNLRPARISEGGGYYSSSKGVICYSGRYLDDEKECFIEIPETLITNLKE